MSWTSKWIKLLAFEKLMKYSFYDYQFVKHSDAHTHTHIQKLLYFYLHFPSSSSPSSFSCTSCSFCICFMGNNTYCLGFMLYALWFFIRYIVISVIMWIWWQVSAIFILNLCINESRKLMKFVDHCWAQWAVTLYCQLKWWKKWKQEKNKMYTYMTERNQIGKKYRRRKKKDWMAWQL